MSQPALSRSVQALERNLGVQLVERKRGGVGITLTQAGRDVLPKADNILRAVSTLRMGRMGAEEEGRSLTFGIGPQFGTVLLPETLRRLMAERPHLTINVSIGSTAVLMEQLVSGASEFFISGRVVGDRPSRVKCVTFASVPMCYAVRPNHPLLNARTIELADISVFPRLAGTVFRDRIMAEEDEVIKCLQPSVCLDNFDVLFQLALSTDGVLATYPGGVRSPLVRLPFDLSAVTEVSETFLFSLEGIDLSRSAIAAISFLRAELGSCQII